MHDTTRENTISGWKFAVLCAIQIWVAHGIAFFVHEYAHSFMTTALGLKANPWMLHFGTPTFANIAIMSQINANIDYAALFAQGHGHLVALIGFAGFGIGNALFYFVCLWMLFSKKLTLRPMWRLFVFWLCLMNVGNFYDYVPIRTVDPVGDIEHIVRGLACPWWAVLIVLGIPTGVAIWHLLRRVFPRVMEQAFPNRPHRHDVLYVVSIWIIFGFYGGVGLLSDSSVAGLLSWVSIAVAWCAIVWFAFTRADRRSARADKLG